MVSPTPYSSSSSSSHSSPVLGVTPFPLLFHASRHGTDIEFAAQDGDGDEDGQKQMDGKANGYTPSKKKTQKQKQQQRRRGRDRARTRHHTMWCWFGKFLQQQSVAKT